MTAELDTLFALRLHTPRLELRLPTTDELRELAMVAAAGVIGPWSEERHPVGLTVRDRPVAERRFELTRDIWERRTRDAWPTMIEGLAGARHLFGT